MENLKIFYESYKKQIILCLMLTILIVITCLSFFQIDKRLNSNKDKEIIASIVEKQTDSVAKEEKTDDPKIIKVDVKGFVVNEGVYSLTEDGRVIDAINEAGGLKEGAYTRYLNLSKKLKDEDVIIVNSFEEIEKMKQEENKNIYCEVTNKACLTEEKVITSIIEEKEEQKEKPNTKEENKLNTLVNINTATKEELMSLNGIGESKADKIIDYRNTHGAFKTIDEIKNVSGIGESVYEKIKEYIEV